MWWVTVNKIIWALAKPRFCRNAEITAFTPKDFIIAFTPACRRCSATSRATSCRISSTRSGKCKKKKTQRNEPSSSGYDDIPPLFTPVDYSITADTRESTFDYPPSEQITITPMSPNIFKILPIYDGNTKNQNLFIKKVEYVTYARNYVENTYVMCWDYWT